MFGTLKIQYDDHGVLALLMVFPIRPFGRYFTAPFIPVSSKSPMIGLMTPCF